MSHPPLTPLYRNPQLTRAPPPHRLAGGLAWLGFLAVGSLGEQVKTRLEVAAEANGTRDVEDAPEVGEAWAGGMRACRCVRQGKSLHGCRASREAAPDRLAGRRERAGHVR